MRRLTPLFAIGMIATALAFPTHAQSTRGAADPTLDDTMVAGGFLDGHPDLKFRNMGLDAYGRKDFVEAINRFKQAASYGDKPSQAALAGMHWEGRGTDRDRALAYAWMDLAAERGYPDFIAMREKFWGELDPTERARALEEGQAIYARYGDEVATPRLERELRRQRMQVVGSRTGFSGNAKIVVPVPGWTGPSSADTTTVIIDGSQFYADKFWEPKQYQAWLDAQWKEPRSGRARKASLAGSTCRTPGFRRSRS